MGCCCWVSCNRAIAAGIPTWGTKEGPGAPRGIIGNAGDCEAAMSLDGEPGLETSCPKPWIMKKERKKILKNVLNKNN